MAAAESNPRIYLTSSTSVLSAPEVTRDSAVPPDSTNVVTPQVTATPTPETNPDANQQPPGKSSRANAAKKNKRFDFLVPIKRKFQALKEWATDRKIRLRVYNDDFIKDIPQLYVTRIIMDDEINLDTDEDRGYIMPDVKKITELGGTPKNLKPKDNVKINWDEFLPQARTPLKKV